MNSTGIIRELAQRRDTSDQEAACLLNDCLEVILDALARDGKVSLRGLGSVEIYRTKPTRRRIPGKAIVDVPAQPRLKVSLSPNVKARLYSEEP